MPTRSPASPVTAIDATSARVKTSWSETASGRKASCTSAKPSVTFAAVYAPTAMNPAWPSENWPVKPFTTLSETARTTFTATLMRTIVAVGGRSGCSAASTRSAAANGTKPPATTRAPFIAIRPSPP